MASTVLQVRVDDSVKKETEEIFHNLGLTMSGAVKLFLNRVIVEQGLPFSMNLKKNDADENQFDPVKFLETLGEKE